VELSRSVLLKACYALSWVLVLASFGAPAVSAQISLQTSEPAAVIGAYQMARNRGDLDAAMAFFSDDATLTQRSTTYTGKEEIHRYLENAIGRGRFIVVSNRVTSGSLLSWVERPAGQNINGIEVGVEATIQDGKIKALSYNGAAFAVRTEPAQDGRSQLPALLGLASVVLVFSGVLLVASTGFPHARVGDSRLRGRLLRDLQVWRSARVANG
jgi:hypothetical protein